MLKYSYDIGQRFGMLTIVNVIGEGKGQTLEMRCDCGGERRLTKKKLYEALRNKGRPRGQKRTTRSSRPINCGCIENQSKDPVYNIWSQIVTRTTSPKHIAWAEYGGRGIGIDPDFRYDFIAFKKHMGPRPSKLHSVERRDNSKGYVKGNIYWADRGRQARNRRSTVWFWSFERGTFLPLSEWRGREMERGVVFNIPMIVGDDFTAMRACYDKGIEVLQAAYEGREPEDDNGVIYGEEAVKLWKQSRFIGPPDLFIGPRKPAEVSAPAEVSVGNPAIPPEFLCLVGTFLEPVIAAGVYARPSKRGFYSLMSALTDRSRHSIYELLAKHPDVEAGFERYTNQQGGCNATVTMKPDGRANAVSLPVLLSSPDAKASLEAREFTVEIMEPLLKTTSVKPTLAERRVVNLFAPVRELGIELSPSRLGSYALLTRIINSNSTSAVGTGTAKCEATSVKNALRRHPELGREMAKRLAEKKATHTVSLAGSRFAVPCHIPSDASVQALRDLGCTVTPIPPAPLVKRGRGRPRKHPLPGAISPQPATQNNNAQQQE